MDWFWTWGGKCFGYRRGEKLFTHDGRQVGKFYGEEVYGSDGRYLGEIKSQRRLITRTAKKNRVKSRFSPTRGGAYIRFVNYVGYVMYAGYEDFLSPERL